MIDKEVEMALAANLLNELEAQSFGETVQLCNECNLFFSHDDMACEGCCNDCSAKHDATFGKHEN